MKFDPRSSEPLMLYDMLDLARIARWFALPIVLHHEFRHLRVPSFFFGGGVRGWQGEIPEAEVKHSTILLLGGGFKDFLFHFDSAGWNGNGMEKKRLFMFIPIWGNDPI